MQTPENKVLFNKGLSGIIFYLPATVANKTTRRRKATADGLSQGLIEGVVEEGAPGLELFCFDKGCPPQPEADRPFQLGSNGGPRPRVKLDLRRDLHLRGAAVSMSVLLKSFSKASEHLCGEGVDASAPSSFDR